jgi:predicted phosphodiesterase
MTRIGIISDTHNYLDENVFDYFKDVDMIWHAGDIGTQEVTDQTQSV